MLRLTTRPFHWGTSRDGWLGHSNQQFKEVKILNVVQWISENYDNTRKIWIGFTHELIIVNAALLQGDKKRRGDSVEDPGQCVRLLNKNHELDDYDDDASLSDDIGAVAETVLDSPPSVAPGKGQQRPPTVGSSHSGSGTRSSSTEVKEAPRNAVKLPLDQTDYLQPQSSLPATYLDLVATPGNYRSTVTWDDAPS